MNNLVFNQNGAALTNSLLVAEKFGKRHGDIIRAIVNLMEDNAILRSHFISATYINEQNKEQPMYIMNRDGFTLLAMGFTGKKALEFKLQYIEAFNQMESALKAIDTPELQMAYGLMAAQKIIDDKVSQIKLLETEKHALVKENQKLAPIADFVDRAILTSDTTVDVGQAAKILKLGYGRNLLFKKLREIGVFFKYRNEPKQEYIQRGYFEVFEIPFKKNGKSMLNLKTVITQDGLLWLNTKLNGSPLQKSIPQFN